MNRRRTASFFGLALALIWGLSFLSIKVSLREVPPMTNAVARFAIACLALVVLARVQKASLRVTVRDLPLLAAGGLTGITLYFLGENHGVALLTASESSVIIGTIPVLTVLSERVFVGTRLGVRTYLGAILSFLGVALIVGKGAGASASLRGYLFMAVAALSWVGYSFLTRPLAGRLHRITITFWQMLFGLIGSVPFALTESAHWQVPGPVAVLNILYLGILCSAVGYWLYVVVLDLLGPGRASVFINLIPVVALAGGFLILGERLDVHQLVGGAVAIAGVFLATTVTGGKRVSAA
jgi:drug/metabolite transporter (DMT)-like permease